MTEKIREYTSANRTCFVDESQITRFCAKCEYFPGPGIPCLKFGSDNQASKVVSQICAWAKVGGKEVMKEGVDGEVVR